MHITNITLNNVRCFNKASFSINAPIVVIQGSNGSGKTTVLEALYYSCYLRSFRTHTSRDLVHCQGDFFFMKIDALSHDHINNQIYIGYSDQEGKVVKLNDKPIKSYKEILDTYRVVSLITEDTQLVSGAPAGRRDFMNYSLLLQNPPLLPTFKRYKSVLEQRNSLLERSSYSLSARDEIMIWTQKAWTDGGVIQQARIDYLKKLENRINKLLVEYFITERESIEVFLNYAPKKNLVEGSFEDFCSTTYEAMHKQELAWKRTLFGPHLDDFSIEFQQKKARIYASRGQQKLIVFLIKIAQIEQTFESGEPGILLLDDFFTEFDPVRTNSCLSLIASLDCQVFLTCPTPTIGNQLHKLSGRGIQIIST